MNNIVRFLVASILMLQTSYASDLVHSKPLNIDYTTTTLRSIFTRKRTFWSDGKRITVFIKPVNSIEHNLFLTSWLGMTKYRYKKLLNIHIYSGRNTNVKTVSSDTEMLLALRSTPYSIGYMTNGSLVYSIEKESDLVVIFYEYE